MDKVDTLVDALTEGRVPWNDIDFETKEFVVFNDKFPVTTGHRLVVPRKASLENINKCFKFAMQMGNENVRSDKNDITGYNVGINMGPSAGQSIYYPHVHLIFRRDGDMDDPQGGVRHVIPEKAKYRKKS